MFKTKEDVKSVFYEKDGRHHETVKEFLDRIEEAGRTSLNTTLRSKVIRVLVSKMVPKNNKNELNQKAKNLERNWRRWKQDEITNSFAQGVREVLPANKWLFEIYEAADDLGWLPDFDNASAFECSDGLKKLLNKLKRERLADNELSIEDAKKTLFRLESLVKKAQERLEEYKLYLKDKDLI